MTARPLRDAKGLFHEEPEDLASSIEARGLRLIEDAHGHEFGIVPYLEEEAIARLRGAGVFAVDESLKREDPGLWRCRWVAEAEYFMRHSMQGPIDATVAYAAAEALVRASQLRQAIEDGQAEKAAALAMLVASWISVGGVSIRLAKAEPLARFARPFAQNSGRGEGAVKRLVREVLGPLKKRLRKEPSHLEVWQACATRRRSGIKFMNDPTWGTPLQAVPANGERPAKWSRFQVIVSEVRRDAKK